MPLHNYPPVVRPSSTAAPEKIGEAVRVAVDFRPADVAAGPRVMPLAFIWSGRKYTVRQLNLRYKRQLGNRFVWCFAVSDEANSYVLIYDPEELTWMLEEVYEASL